MHECMKPSPCNLCSASRQTEKDRQRSLSCTTEWIGWCREEQHVFKRWANLKHCKGHWRTDGKFTAANSLVHCFISQCCPLGFWIVEYRTWGFSPDLVVTSSSIHELWCQKETYFYLNFDWKEPPSGLFGGPRMKTSLPSVSSCSIDQRDLTHLGES